VRANKHSETCIISQKHPKQQDESAECDVQCYMYMYTVPAAYNENNNNNNNNNSAVALP